MHNKIIRKHKMRLKIILIICSIFFTFASHAKDYNELSTRAERDSYVLALKYYKSKNFKKFEKVKNTIKNYPLYPYLEYKSLHRKRHINDEKVIKFIKKYKHSYISEKAYINLIYRLSSRNKITKLISNYKDTDSVDLKCLYLRAKIKKKSLSNIDDEIIPIWLSAKSQPKSCDYVFHWFYKNKKLTDELVWQRIKISLDSNNYYLARYLIRFLSNKNKAYGNKLLKVYRNPIRNIISKDYSINNRYRDTILSYGLYRIAKKNYVSARKNLIKIKKLYKLNDSFYEKKLVDIYIIALKSNQRNISLDNNFLSLNSKNLDFNLALSNYYIYNSNWKLLLDSIINFPDSIIHSQKWTYWKGKALYKLNRNSEYKDVLAELSSKRSYYGFLSANILDVPLNITSISYPASDLELEKLKNDVSVQIMYELHMIGRYRDSRMELDYFYKNSQYENLNYLNVLIKTWGWNDGVILGYGHTKYYDDVEARFPIMHESYFDKYSNTNIEKVLLLGIARKESIFIEHAKSSAGAIGIMQVLPKTAYWVLRKANRKKVSINSLYKPKINIFIGSYYFNYLISKKKSIVEAIASYNAGPNMVTKWRNKNKAPEDAWIEYIPFKETKKYVKSVIEYSLVYDWVINKKNTIRVSQIIDVN